MTDWSERAPPLIAEMQRRGLVASAQEHEACDLLIEALAERETLLAALQQQLSVTQQVLTERDLLKARERVALRARALRLADAIAAAAKTLELIYADRPSDLELPECGCAESYPQLRPGRISHGPGCPRTPAPSGTGGTP